MPWLAAAIAHRHARHLVLAVIGGSPLLVAAVYLGLHPDLWVGSFCL